MNPQLQEVKHSTAEAPDLDWSQVRETILMLKLATAQIENSLRSGDDSVSTLADSFTSMAGDVEIIQLAAQNLPKNADKSSCEANTILEKCHSVSSQMHNAIIAFQFYDKLTQRLTHLSKSLGAVADVVNEPKHLYDPYVWLGLQEKIKSTYTVQSDIKMFEAILAGKSVEEALQACNQVDDSQDQQDEDDVELF